MATAAGATRNRRAGAKRAGKRAYRMGARADAAAATLERIRDAATGLFSELSYDEVSLEAVARRAASPSTISKLGSKDALFVECARAVNTREEEDRAVAPGDVRGAARVLARRYEQLLPLWRHLGLEQRFPIVAEAVAEVRERHLAWLEAAFEPFLSPRRGKPRARQLAALFGATEIYLWWTWRTHLGLDALEAEQTMLDFLEALVARWAAEARRGADDRRVPVPLRQWDGGGNVPPELGLARRLVERGHAVRVLGIPRSPARRCSPEPSTAPGRERPTAGALSPRTTSSGTTSAPTPSR